MVSRALSFVFLCCLLISSHSFASVRAYVDRTELFDDEPLILTINVSPQGELSREDLEALEELFIIEQRSQQQMTRIVNGNRSSQTDYRFRLTPRQTGNITIPSFTVGNNKSNTLLVTVKPSQDRKDALADDALLLSVSTSTDQPYVDQPFTLTIELAYRAQLSGDIVDPVLTNFDVTPLSTDQTQKVINGKTYNIYRKIYQLIGHDAGNFAIPPVRFSGEYLNPQAARYERITRVADVGVINVRPIPAEYPANAYWLPVNNLTLTENLVDRKTINANEHLDWQLTLSAEGLSGRQLPDPLVEFETKLDPNIRLYRDEPVFNGSSRIDKQAISVSRGGAYRLPAIRIPWWNVTDDQLMWLEVPEKVINVNETTTKGNDNAQQTTPQKPVGQPNLTDEQASDSKDGTQLEETGQPDRFALWLLLLSLTLLLLSALTVYILWQSKRRTNTNNEGKANKQKQPSLIDLARTDNHAELYQQVLLDIEIKGLTIIELKENLTLNNRHTLEQLERFLFADESIPPSQAEQLNLVKNILATSTKKPTSVGSNFNLYPR